MYKTWLWLLPLVPVAGVFMWAADVVTGDGERTVYAAGCDKGEWEQDRCTGKLVAAERFRFRVLRAHREVFFWNVGVESDPTGKLINCTIIDGRNWVCPASVEGPKPIILEMARGKPIREFTGKTRASHPVSKIRWTLLKYGISLGDTAVCP